MKFYQHHQHLVCLFSSAQPHILHPATAAGGRVPTLAQLSSTDAQSGLAQANKENEKLSTHMNSK